MEGDAVLSSMDSLWFYSSVFLRPSSKHKESECAQEPQQGSTETNNNKTTSGGPCQAPKCVKEAAAQTARRPEGGGMERTAAARGRSWEWDERMVAWQKEQRRRALVAAAARCSQPTTMPAPPGPGEGLAMKAHLRSWAHAVACSVR